MRALLQRVTEASVSVEGEIIGSIAKGLVVLLGVGKGDAEEDARYLAGKIAGFRIFEDLEGKFNLSALDIGGEVLVVSQFTLLADTKKGKRPSFTQAAPPDEASKLIEFFISLIKSLGLKVSSGQFQAHMQVKLCNDGPVTIMIDSQNR